MYTMYIYLSISDPPINQSNYLLIYLSISICMYMTPPMYTYIDRSISDPPINQSNYLSTYKSIYICIYI